MPFPVDIMYIELLENSLKVIFPEIFKKRMMKENGGELSNEEYYFELYPFFDKSNKKRLSRTCNHIGKETESARQWDGFPDNAIAIGTDGSGNRLVLIHNGDGRLKEELFCWDHETGAMEKIANRINEIETD